MIHCWFSISGHFYKRDSHLLHTQKDVDIILFETSYIYLYYKYFFHIKLLRGHLIWACWRVFLPRIKKKKKAHLLHRVGMWIMLLPHTGGAVSCWWFWCLGIIDLLSTGTLQGWSLEHDHDLVRDCKHASLNHGAEPGRAGRGPLNTTKLRFSHTTTVFVAEF